MTVQFQMIDQPLGTLVKLSGPDDGNRIHTVEVVNSALALINRFVMSRGMLTFGRYVDLCEGNMEGLSGCDVITLMGEFREFGLVNGSNDPNPVTKSVALSLVSHNVWTVTLNPNFCSPFAPAAPAPEPEAAQPVG